MIGSKKTKVVTIAMTMLMLVIATVTGVVMAASNYTITINGAGSGHEYSAYQVFTGTLDADKTGVLSNIQWGTGVDSANLLSALQSSVVSVNERQLAADGTSSEATGSQKTIGEIFKGCTEASEVADILALYENDSDMLREFAEIVSKNLKEEPAPVKSTYEEPSYKIEVESAGYYFIKDSKDLGGTDEAHTRYILNVIKDQEVNAKGSVPTVTKTITTEAGAKKAVSAEIGETLSFELKGTMPTTYDDYGKYQYDFYDTLPEGLKYVESSAHVYLVNDGDEQDITEKFEVTSEGTSLNIKAVDGDVKGIEGLTSESEIVVRYQATVEKEATLGQDGNVNQVVLKFSNNPNAGQEASLGETPANEVKVFTYELDIEKQNGKTKAPLSGAGFKLYKDREGTTVYAILDDETKTIKEWTETEASATELLTDGSGKVTVKGLKAGKYSLKETTVPDGYNQMDDVELEITEEITGSEVGSVTQTLDSFSLKSTVKESSTTTSGDLATGAVKATILNFPGALLPSTGGIGTVIFYVIGGLLIVGSALYLVRAKVATK